MTLSISDRINLKTAIAQKISPKDWVDVDLALEEHGLPVNGWSGEVYDYVLSMLRDASDDKVLQLASHLGIETELPSSPAAPGFWAGKKLKIFLSHLAEYKVFASDIQSELSRFGAAAFVAHEDIEPTAEWQDEIEKALGTCDAWLLCSTRTLIKACGRIRKLDLFLEGRCRFFQ